MTLEGGLFAFGPLMVWIGLVFFVAIPGLLWSPFASLIAWRIARHKGLDGRRYAMSGAAYSVFMFLPWVHLIAGLSGYRVPRFPITVTYLLLHWSWLTGPLMMLTQIVAESWLELDTLLEHIVAYSIWTIMILGWIVSASLKLRAVTSVKSKYVIYFLLALACVSVACALLFYDAHIDSNSISVWVIILLLIVGAWFMVQVDVGVESEKLDPPQVSTLYLAPFVLAWMCVLLGGCALLLSHLFDIPDSTLSHVPAI